MEKFFNELFEKYEALRLIFLLPLIFVGGWIKGLSDKNRRQK